jgi:nitrite reductase/ring-hydroxylating ferredoxin subunit
MTDDTNDYRAVGPSDELVDSWANPYYLADLKLRIGVARVDGALFAFDDVYESANGPCPLTAGLLEGTVIMSQCDGSRFELSTGAVVRGPASGPLKVHPVRETAGQIEVAI